MPPHEIISIGQYVVVGLSLAMLIYMLWQGKLREKHLRLGPTRDLHQPKAIYLVGAYLVMGYAVVKLQVGGDVDSEINAYIEIVPVIVIGLLLGLAIRVDAGFRKVGLLPRHPVRDLRWGFWGGVIGFGLAGLSGIVAAWVMYLVDEPTPQVSHETLVVLRERFSVDLLVTIFITAVVVAPLFEELVFRGVLQTSLMRLMNGRRWLAILMSAAVFSAIHAWVVPAQALAPLFMLGLVFGYIYERTGSLLTPILAHAVFNATNIAIALTLP